MLKFSTTIARKNVYYYLTPIYQFNWYFGFSILFIWILKDRGSRACQIGLIYIFQQENQIDSDCLDLDNLNIS